MQAPPISRAIGSLDLRRVAGLVVGLPRLFQVGLAIFGLGAAGDLAYHLLPGPLGSAVAPLLGAEAVHAHMVTLLGMVTIFLAVLRRGVSHGR